MTDREMAVELAAELERLHDVAYRCGGDPRHYWHILEACEAARLTLGSYADATRSDEPNIATPEAEADFDAWVAAGSPLPWHPEDAP